MGERRLSLAVESDDLDELLYGNDEYTEAGIDNEAVDRQEKTRVELVDYFGSQQFSYGGHVGTIADILELCPAVGSLVGAGFDAVVSFVSGHEISDDEAEKIRNPQPENQPLKDELHAADNEEQSRAEKTDTHSKEVKVSEIKVTVSRQETKVLDHLEVRHDLADGQEGSYAIERQAKVDDLSDDVAPTPLPANEIMIEINDTENSEEVKQNTQTGERDVATTEVVAATYASEVVTTVDDLNEQAAEKLERVIPMVDAAEQVSLPIPPEQFATPLPALVEKLPPAYDAFLEPPQYTSREMATVSIHAPVKDVSLFQLPVADFVPPEIKPFETPEFTLGEMYDNTLEMPEFAGESEQNIELQLTESVEYEGETNTEEITVGAVEMDEDMLHDSSTVEVPANSLQAVIEEQEPFSPQNEMIVGIIAELVGDDVPKKYNYHSPEFLHHSEEVVKKIELLEKAATAEECRELLREIRLELATLLTLLGCKDVEGTVAKLMADLRNIERIKRYIEALLMMAVQPEISATRAQIHATTHPRCHRVGQWVVRTLTGGVTILRPAWDITATSGSALQIQYRS